jgi:D-amino-acid dehydrogenase
VTVVERGGPDHDSCSLGNAGMIVPSHFVPLAAPGMVSLGLRMMWHPESPFYIKPRWDSDLMSWCWRFMRSSTRRHVERCAPILRDMHLASREGFEAMSAVLGGDIGLVQKGLLMLCQTQRALDEERHGASRARGLGVAAEVLSPEATARLDPAIRMNIAGAVYYPGDCHLSPNRFMASLTRWLQAHGAVFQWNTEVQGWNCRGGTVQALQTAAGELSADAYVLAGGSWSPGLARGLGLKLPMQAGKGYSLTLPEPRQLPQLCSILSEARVAVTPMGQSLRFGGTMEMAGLDETINPARVHGIIRAASGYFPEFKFEDFKGVKPWRGLRPCSPDGMPYVGRPGGYRNLVVATGHAMMGLSLGPVTGRLTAELLTGETPSIDLGLLRPDRFG